MDFANLKSLTIPKGEVAEITCNGVLLWKGGCTNLVPTSTAAAGGTAIYNNGLGYKEGYRLSSSGAEKAQSGSVVTGFISAKRGDVIRMKGVTWGTTVSGGYCYLLTYNASGSVVHLANKYENDSSDNHISNQTGIDVSNSSILTDSNGVTTFNLTFSNTKDFSYIRISATGKGANMIVTVNEEIE